MTVESTDRMVDIRYLKFLLFAAVACGLCAFLIWLQSGDAIKPGPAAVSFVLGAAVTSLVTIRLPVFRQYYNATWPHEIRKYGGFANMKAAAVMTGLVAGLVVGSVLYVFGVKDVVPAALIAMTCGTVISQYHSFKR